MLTCCFKLHFLISISEIFFVDPFFLPLLPSFLATHVAWKAPVLLRQRAGQGTGLACLTAPSQAWSVQPCSKEAGGRASSETQQRQVGGRKAVPPLLRAQEVPALWRIPQGRSMGPPGQPHATRHTRDCTAWGWAHQGRQGHHPLEASSMGVPMPR